MATVRNPNPTTGAGNTNNPPVFFGAYGPPNTQMGYTNQGGPNGYTNYWSGPAGPVQGTPPPTGGQHYVAPPPPPSGGNTNWTPLLWLGGLLLAVFLLWPYLANREVLATPPPPSETVRLSAEGPADKLGDVHLSRGESCCTGRAEQRRNNPTPPIQKEVRTVYVRQKSTPPPPVEDAALRERLAYLEGMADAGRSNNTVTIENSISPSGEQTTFTRQVYVDRVVPAGGYYEPYPVQYAQPYPVNYGYGGAYRGSRMDRTWYDINQGLRTGHNAIGLVRDYQQLSRGGCQYGCVNPCNHGGGQQQQYQQQGNNPGSVGHNGWGEVRVKSPRGPR